MRARYLEISELSTSAITDAGQLFFQYGIELLPSGLVFPLSYLPIIKFSRLRAVGRKLASIGDGIIRNKVDALTRGLELDVASSESKCESKAVGKNVRS
jgi:hypothetical protein